MNWAPGQKSAATKLCSPRTLRLHYLTLNFRRLVLHMRFRACVSRRPSRESEHNPPRIETEHRAQPTIAVAGCGLDYTTRLRGSHIRDLKRSKHRQPTKIKNQRRDTTPLDAFSEKSGRSRPDRTFP